VGKRLQLVSLFATLLCLYFFTLRQPESRDAHPTQDVPPSAFMSGIRSEHSSSPRSTPAGSGYNAEPSDEPEIRPRLPRGTRFLYPANPTWRRVWRCLAMELVVRNGRASKSRKTSPSARPSIACMAFWRSAPHERACAARVCGDPILWKSAHSFHSD
jgi:hypothetical protein